MAKLEVRAFRFNAEFDYLPTYQPFDIAASSMSVREALVQIKRLDPLYACDLNAIDGARLNGIGVTLDHPIDNSARVATIEPLSLKRATRNLHIDDSDFYAKFAIFAPFADEDDRLFYDRFKIAYYLSPMLDLRDEYLGEAVFMLADRLIAKYPDRQNAILEQISAQANGIFNFIWLESLGDKNMALRIANTVRQLQALSIEKGVAPKGAVVANEPALREADLTRDLCGKSVAIATDSGAFCAPKADDLAARVVANGGKYIKLSNPSCVSGYSLAALQPRLAIEAAAKLLLEAEDLGADTLVCAAIEARDFLNKNRRLVAEVAGRQIDIAIA
ncbi:MAG: DUF5644 domain-containing protein [Helicobacteraceae bacterium]|jgi:succinate dehydrogenase/fumarate reductase-like Fe-S protein|nr:DUF5644 domain-containing protein [Helicobacteraceae bacterium]